jgi:hypothetical protein
VSVINLDPVLIALEHEPEKHALAKAGVNAGFRKRSCPIKKIKRDDDSRKVITPYSARIAPHIRARPAKIKTATVPEHEPAGRPPAPQARGSDQPPTSLLTTLAV